MAYTTIKKPSDYFNTVTYTGTAGGQTISGVGHQPDFIWVKQRGDAGYDHSLHNSVSGLLKQLISNSTDAEITNTDTITSNNSDGFVLGADTAGPNANTNNQDTKNYVAWNWKANGAGSANTDGSISSTVSASATSGFSIVSYSGNGTGGATVGHGLGSALGLIILKCRDTAGTSWQMFHKSLGATKSINLEDTAAAATSTAYWNDTAPTSSVFSLGTGGDFNNGSRTYVAYCFAEKQGYSKFGSYTGNASADGTFVYTGFKPAFLMIKRATGGTGNWHLFDSKRLGYNVNNYGVQPNLNNAENTANDLDLLSNGFKNRQSGNDLNGSNTYIYMAFAEEPLVGDNPATAR
jgi:hypothetical protein